MTTTEPTITELEEVALDRLEAEAGHVEDGLDELTTTPIGDGGPSEPIGDVIRVALAVAMPVIAAAVMIGGVFEGAAPRVYAAVAGSLGIVLGVLLSRVRNAVATNILAVAGLFLVGVVMVVPGGLQNVARLAALTSEAAASGEVLRPPVEFLPGWRALSGWLMAIVGFVSVWVAVTVRRPSAALLVPLPFAAIAGISVPQSDQVASGIAALVLFAIGLGLLSSANQAREAEERPPVGYEVRRALRSLPLVAVITAALYGLAQLGFLFPSPVYDPAQEPQRPRTVPLSEVEDRVLFTVDASFSGPWRIGSLDVYDGADWRLPPFAESELEDVPRTGIVDDDLDQGVSARFTVAGLGGAVLPGLPNTVGIAAAGPRLAYDARNGSIRVSQGQIRAGLEYTVTAAAVPSEEALRAAPVELPPQMAQFTHIPPPPPAVQDLVAEAGATYENRWDQFNFLRLFVLEEVTASGTGTPVSVTPDRVADMISGSREGSPFEIVAAQAMLARWIGIPSRIGYGYDGGEVVDGVLEVRPRHGASFVEVYFPGHKWLPVIGTPRQARPTVGNDPSHQQFDPNVLPSDEASVQLFLPVVVPPDSRIVGQVVLVVAAIMVLATLITLAYTTWPVVRKAIVRSRRRAAAERAGPRARTALAYAEWRDFAADFGFPAPTDTPLMFLDRFTPDDEHAELAWLTTRVLWGDLRESVGTEEATTAEELSRALRRRLAQAQPATVRAVALLSRTSLRSPYAPATDLTRQDDLHANAS